MDGCEQSIIEKPCRAALQRARAGGRALVGRQARITLRGRLCKGKQAREKQARVWLMVQVQCAQWRVRRQSCTMGPTVRSAACRVLTSSMAIVMGPTPPGTGVM